MERKAEMNLRKPMHGVRWQSEARTPTPLWLGCDNSWPLHSPHGGGQMTMWRIDGAVRNNWMFLAQGNVFQPKRCRAALATALHTLAGLMR